MVGTIALRYTYKTQPFEHQKKALAKIHHLGGVAGLFMPMRTGKTKTVIDWAGIAFHNYGVRKVLVVCPVSVMGVWEQEIRAHSSVPWRTTILTGAAKNKVATIESLRRSPPEYLTWIIINYEAIWRVAKGRKRIDEYLSDWGPDLIVADESHRIKTAGSRQSRSMARLGKAAKMRLALTGTPITKAPLDAFGQFRFLNPSIFSDDTGPMNWTEFKNHYGVWGGFRGFELKGYRHLDELVAKIRTNSFRMSLEQCFPSLPPRTYIDLPVHMPVDAWTLYRKMRDDMLLELESGQTITADIVLTKLLFLSEITSGFINEPGGNSVELHTAKTDAALDLIQDMLDEGEKVVVFCRFKHDYDALFSALDRKGHRYVKFVGGMDSSERQAAITAFNNDPAVDVFVGQTATGALGIDLTAARFIIHYSLSYNWADYVQANERIYGPKQSRPISIHHLVVPRSIDSVVLNVLQHKGDLARAVLHDPKLLLG